MKRDEYGRKPDDPLYGKAQPRNVNESDFDVLEDYLDAQTAPAEVFAALAALRERWALGRKMSQQLRARNRELERAAN
jgi:hypothetical protein